MTLLLDTLSYLIKQFLKKKKSLDICICLRGGGQINFVKARDGYKKILWVLLYVDSSVHSFSTECTPECTNSISQILYIEQVKTINAKSH